MESRVELGWGTTDPEKIKIPVPMRDVQRIYAALGSLKRIAANEGNDEFVETLEGLMDRLEDYHNAVVTGWGAGQDAPIRESEEDRSALRGQEPQPDALPQAGPIYWAGCTAPKTRHK